MIDRYLADFDFNLPLDDATGDPEIVFVRRKLAHVARSEGLDGGYYEAQELAEAFLDAAREANAQIVDEESPARLRLTDILDRNSPYQRALFDAVAELPLPDAASHLCWLTDLMKSRAEMFRPVQSARLASN